MKILKIAIGAALCAVTIYFAVPPLSALNDRAIRANWDDYMLETNAQFEALFQMRAPRNRRELAALDTYIRNTIQVLRWQAEYTPGTRGQRAAAAQRVTTAQRLVQKLQSEYATMD